MNYPEQQVDEKLNIQIRYIDYKSMQEYVDMHCRYFDLEGLTLPISHIENRFPHIIDGDSLLHVGNTFVKDNFTWKKQFEQVSFGLNNRLVSIYCLACFTPEESEHYTEIIKKCLIDQS